MTTTRAQADGQGLLSALVGDGQRLIAVVALGLFVSGLFALFLAARGEFLPHDIAFLGMEPAQLCALHQCRVVHFIFHDRVSFGGTLMAVGTLYLWLLEFPLRRGETWAWWTLLASGTVGFLSFFSYLVFGYLDTWHAVASGAMLPLFLAGLAKTRSLVRSSPVREPLVLRTRAGAGRACLVFVGAGMVLAGLTIMTLGSTVVFVPQDITYMGFSAAQLTAINAHLLPLIAHDRAGFGGGLASCGIAVMAIAWNAKPSRALWQAELIGGLTGFGCAIGIHYPMGYMSASHLAPAWCGAMVYAVGVVLLAKPSLRG